MFILKRLELKKIFFLQFFPIFHFFKKDFLAKKIKIQKNRCTSRVFFQEMLFDSFLKNKNFIRIKKINILQNFEKYYNDYNF